MNRTIPSHWPLGVLKFVLIGLAVILAILPTLIALGAIFKGANELAGPQTWIPQLFTLENITRVLGDDAIWTWVRNSAIIAGGVALVVLVFGIPAGYVLARREFFGKRTFLLLIIVTQTVAPAVLIIPLFRLLASTGALNNFWGVIFVAAAFVLPFSIWLLTGFFAEALPREVEEAASLDGASGFTFLVRILVANAVPGIVATGIFAFMYGWNDYIFALTFLNDQAKWPIAVGASSSVGLFAVDWGKLMLASLVGTVPIMVLFVLFRRPLENGLSGAR